jgi:AraC family transcriptional regulator
MLNSGLILRDVEVRAVRDERVTDDCQSVGSYGAFVASFERSAGHYRDGARPNFAVMMLQNGGFPAEFDLGVGKFAVRSVPGQLFVCRPFISIENAFQATVKILMLSLPVSTLGTLLPGLDLEPETGFRELYTRPLCDDFIRIAINRLWATTRSRQDGASLFADTVVLAIFAALARHGKRARAETKRGLADWQLRRVMEMLQSMQEVPLAALAAAANISPWHFARAFKHTTGVPPHHYQLMLRMNCAKDLLTKTGLPITKVAERVGYGSSQALARAFRKEVGTSPLEYRCSSAA